MIAKISSGKSTAGLIRYLFDTKRAKGHTDPHLVGSWDGFAPDPGRAEDSDAARKLLVADLDLHVKQAERLGRAPEKHVWHCSVRAAGSDRILTDEEWADIARRVVHATGIAPEGDADGCRWVAVRHAPDHIHIAATTVRADLRTARHWNDYLTADRELAAVEKHYGLHQVVRGDRTAAKRPTRAEQEKAKRAGHKKTPRERLRAAARTAVAAATSPEEFLALLEHTEGVLVDVKRFPSGDVRGYTLALEGDTNSEREPIWYSGSKLSPDLSWPRISERLTATAATAAPWQDVITAAEYIPRALAHDGAPAAQAHITALGETLDALPLLTPAPYREELRRAAAAFERASRSRIHAENHHAARLRAAVKTMLRTPPPNSSDGTLLALLLDTIVLATAAALRWHDLHHHDQQVTATRDALTHLHTAADQAATTALATVKRAQPTSPAVRLRYEHTLRTVLPDHANTILNTPDWDALTAALARALVADVDKAAGAIDRERERKRGDLEPPARKPGVGPLHGPENDNLHITPWEMLSVFARASTLARQGRGRGLAEHWQALKYCQALGVGTHGYLALTEEGEIPELAYRGMQARELGRALGLAVAERTVRNRYPDHLVSVLDAEVALLAGFARSGPRPTLGARPRPDFFLEVWQPGEPSRVFVVTVNGNHQVATKRTGKADRSAFKQLARASERVEQYHLAEWNTTPCLLLSTELMAKEGITVNALQAPGRGLLPSRPTSGRESADAVLSGRNPPYAGAVKVPGTDGQKERIQDGFLIPRKNLGWYGQLLARTAAAGQLALAGAGNEVAQYLTDEQGRKHYTQRTFAGSSSVRDACHKIGSKRFLGTDQVFRLGGTRVEAFSGMDEELYQLLIKGKVEACRHRAYEKRDTLPTGTEAPEWGPISFFDDGTVVALRILPPGQTQQPRSGR